MCWAAAGKGDLKVVTYLHEKGSPWDVNASMAAAKLGHLEVLKYLCANGCPWDPAVCAKTAEENGHKLVVKWIQENSQ